MRAASRFASRLIAWFRENKRDLPWRKTNDPYAIWISEIMLQQTQVKTVIPYWERWMRELPTLRALARAKPERVLKLWEGLGYYSRARNLQKAAQEILRKQGGIFPNRYESILELPGIGRYTAGAIGSIAFGLPTPIVDGNVARVLARYLGLRGDPKSGGTSAALWAAASTLARAAQELNACRELSEGLMELGATVCLPKQPWCGRCPMEANCFARKNSLVAQLPEMAPRAGVATRVYRAAIVTEGGRILLRKRGAETVNGGFWELPNAEADGEKPAETLCEVFGGRKLVVRKVCDVKHTIMNLRITTEIYAVGLVVGDGCKWFEFKDLIALPMVTAHRKGLVKAGYLKSLDGKQENTLWKNGKGALG